MVGHTSEAIEERRRAARTLRAAGDTIWEARALNNLGNALIDRGDARRAEEALTLWGSITRSRLAGSWPLWG